MSELDTKILCWTSQAQNCQWILDVFQMIYKQQRCVHSIIEFYCFPPISTNVDDQLNFSCCHYDTVTIVIIVIACVIITISVIINALNF